MTPENPQITAAKKENNPATVLRMQSGFVVMYPSQFLPGYCMLLAYPQVQALQDLPHAQRVAFLTDMSVIGEAIEAICQPNRINYAILGNKDPFLHAHIIPRYVSESEAYRLQSIWSYPDAIWTDLQHTFSAEKHSALRDAIKQKIVNL